MAVLGPFEVAPRLAAGVSGGADSMALALLADRWARDRGGALTALVVDHRLRPESTGEAAATVAQLARLGIAARLLTLIGLRRGPGLAEQARAARYEALHAACAAAGILHLLLGHHAADQAETLLLRREGNSGPSGLAAMPAISEHRQLRLLRPLLRVPPMRLRATVAAAGLGWIDDPSNTDLRATRPRLRAQLADPDGIGPATQALVAEAHAAGLSRAAAEAMTAARLAERASLRPEGFAILSPGPIEPAALAALIQTVSGAGFPPASAAIARLAAQPRAATLAGVRLLPAGRLGPGWLLVREPAAMAPPVAARPGALWDGRFRLSMAARPPPDMMIGPLGDHAARLRRRSPLPAVVLRTLPAIWERNLLAAVPHLLYPDPAVCAGLAILFSPRRPAAGAPFLPA